MKLKRKVVTMKRSSTIHTFLPIEEEALPLTSNVITIKQDEETAKKGLMSQTSSCSNLNTAQVHKSFKETSKEPKTNPSF